MLLTVIVVVCFVFFCIGFSLLIVGETVGLSVVGMRVWGVVLIWWFGYMAGLVAPPWGFSVVVVFCFSVYVCVLGFSLL